LGVGAALLAAALFFSAGYTVSAFQHFGSSKPPSTAAAAASLPLCEATTARISFDSAPGAAVAKERDDLRRKLTAAEARVSVLEKEIGNARRNNGRCSFSPDVMRMLDDASKVDR
jgi:hypothetical protein